MECMEQWGSSVTGEKERENGEKYIQKKNCYYVLNYEIKTDLDLVFHSGVFCNRYLVELAHHDRTHNLPSK